MKFIVKRYVSLLTAYYLTIAPKGYATGDKRESSHFDIESFFSLISQLRLVYGPYWIILLLLLLSIRRVTTQIKNETRGSKSDTPHI